MRQRTRTVLLITTLGTLAAAALIAYVTPWAASVLIAGAAVQVVGLWAAQRRGERIER